MQFYYVTGLAPSGRASAIELYKKDWNDKPIVLKRGRMAAIGNDSLRMRSRMRGKF